MTLDTQVLIWGVQEISSPSQGDMVPRAKLFIDHLSTLKNVRVILPSIVVGEYLAGVRPEEHDTVIQQFRRRFEIVPYDVAAAACAAQLWRKHKAESISNAGREVLPIVPCDRTALIADIQILGTAMTRQVTWIFSEDPHIQRLSEVSGRIAALPIPDVSGGQESLDLWAEDVGDEPSEALG